MSSVPWLVGGEAGLAAKVLNCRRSSPAGQAQHQAQVLEVTSPWAGLSSRPFRCSNSLESKVILIVLHRPLPTSDFETLVLRFSPLTNIDIYLGTVRGHSSSTRPQDYTRGTSEGCKKQSLLLIRGIRANGSLVDVEG